MKGNVIYMVGIGGIGLSALAQLYAREGARVVGSDRNDSPTTAMLQERGVEVFIGHDANHVPEDASLLVYSDAVPSDNPERVRGRELGIPELNYFEALGRAAQGKRVVAVSGTHGKTTTTAMLGKILVDAGCDPTVVVGSIVSEWGSNFRAGESDLFVVEACEYRRHFLSLHARVLVITNIEFDHTDYFKDLDDVIDAFRESIEGIEPGGEVVANPALPAVAQALAGAAASVRDYSLVQVSELRIPGTFNVENAKAAKAAAEAIAPQLSERDIDAALAAFKGTWRRFEHKGTLPSGAELYDDYAHHPSAIAKTITAAKEKFHDKKIAVFFHPHLYSRTRDLFDEFARSLAAADEAYILPVYAAREAFDASVSNEALAAAITKAGGHARAVSGMDEAAALLRELPSGTVAFTMGAGDVYRAGEQALAQENPAPRERGVFR